MKRIYIILVGIGLSCMPLHSAAQAQEAMQLALNIQKLNQLRKILQNMYDGYQILMKGYNRVKDIVEGNFKLHDLFLDGLMQVSPTVRKYHKVAAIVTKQKQLVEGTKALLDQARHSERFSLEEMEYFSRVVERLSKESWDNLDALLMVVTARQLRMTDAERLEAIDRIFESVQGQQLFLQAFTKEAQLLVQQREQHVLSNERLRVWHGLPKN